MEKPSLLLVYSTQASQQLGKHTSLAVEQVIRCVKYAGVQTEFPKGLSPAPEGAMWLGQRSTLLRTFLVFNP